ncbi:MAG: hypothetical protein AB7K09_20155 [Planctomycetota bacterium]
MLTRFRPSRSATSHRRGASFVEIGVAIALITIMVLIVPKVMSAVVISAERQLQESAGHRLAEAWLSSSLVENYASLVDGSSVIDTQTLSFSRDGQAYTVDYVVERAIVTDSSLGAGKEFKRVTIRVTWPDNANPSGEIVKATIVSQ